jgi:hypothetical protein
MQPLQIWPNRRRRVKVGGKYYAEAPEGSPEWGIRTTLTFLFPKK